jgi:hypothetical protein
LIGGRAPHAIERAAKYGDGWFPMSRTPQNLAAPIREYRELTEAMGRPPGQIAVSTRLPLDDEPRTRALLDEYRTLGVDRLVCGLGYDTIEEFRSRLESLAAALA